MKYLLPIAAFAVLLDATGYSARAATVPYTESLEVLNQEALYFSAPTKGLRAIRNISCAIRVSSVHNIGAPALLAGSSKNNDVQAIFFPVTSMGFIEGSYLFVNTTPILVYVKPGDSVSVTFGLPPVDNVLNGSCTLTGETTY